MNLKNIRVIFVFLPIVGLIILMTQKDKIMNSLSDFTAKSLSNASSSSGEEDVYQAFTLPESNSSCKGTLIEFGAENCISCRRMKSTLKEIEASYSDKIAIQVFNITEPDGLEMGKKFGMVMIPMQVLLDRNGKVLFKHVGFITSEALSEKINQLLDF